MFRPDPQGGHEHARGHGWGHARTDLRFQWSGDTAGQGWGINQAFGGMRIYETMRQRDPLFFLHSGDTIYADGPIAASVVAENGQVWNNLVTPEVSKVAETLDEFRGRYRYNLLDETCAASTPKSADLAMGRSRGRQQLVRRQGPLRRPAVHRKERAAADRARDQGLSEYAPMRPFDVRKFQRVYRSYSYGPLLELFVVDMRSYRGPNTANLQTTPSSETVFLGREQLDWLKAGLEESRAVWKVVAADMPLGLNVGDGPRWEAIANGEHGPAKGRELEFVELFVT